MAQIKVRHYSRASGAFIDGHKVESKRIQVRSSTRQLPVRRSIWWKIKALTYCAFSIGFLMLIPVLDKQNAKEVLYAADTEKAATVEATSIPPIMERIAKCESGGKQFNADGSLVRGKVTFPDVGKWQISEKHWEKKARELGFDLRTEEGNTAMALWLYSNYGTEPWFPSKTCWAK